MAGGLMENDGDSLRMMTTHAVSESGYISEEFLILYQRQNVTTAA
jgi:hypothetical protein